MGKSDSNFSVRYETKERIKKDKKFYLSLGFTDEQAKYLAHHAFGVKYTSNEKEIPKRNEFFGGGRIGTLGSGVRGLVFKATSSAKCTLDSLEDDGAVYDAGPDYEESFCAMSFAEETCEAPVMAREAAFVNQISPIENILEQVKYDKYAKLDVAGFKKASMSPLSTFSSTVNTASMATIREKLAQGIEIDRKMVRTEELINFFDYNVESDSDTFKINTEYTGDKLFIGVKARETETPRQNIVFLIDVSGSMDIGDKPRYVQKSVMAVLSQLHDGDIISIVTYSTKDNTVIAGMKYSKDIIDNFIKTFTSIRIEGCTYGSAGINRAYEIIDKYYIKGGSNRVILMTDGDFNFGVCDNEKLEDFVKERKDKSGAFMTTLGFGCGVYDDEKMEIIAKNGNGNYFRIVDDFEISEILRKKLNSTLVTVAKDVKIQVEFNPQTVDEYRLIGYENRMLAAEDFKNDEVQAEPMGSGHLSVALYDIKPLDKDIKQESSLKYATANNEYSDEVCTVKIRFKDPEADTSQEISKVVKVSDLVEASDNVKLAHAVEIFADYLRGTNKEQGIINEIIDILDSIKSEKLANSEKVVMLRELIAKA